MWPAEQSARPDDNGALPCDSSRDALTGKQSFGPVGGDGFQEDRMPEEFEKVKESPGVITLIKVEANRAVRIRSEDPVDERIEERGSDKGNVLGSGTVLCMG